jgi:glutamate-1-semialdehyde 2,1-aminomutase
MIDGIEATYRSRTPRSAALAARAEAVMPGGDTRSATYHRPYPLTITEGTGHEIVDADGNRYLDLIMNYTSLAHGHAYPPIVEAVARQVSHGSAWAARNLPQLELAETLVERVGSVERMRFTNSGTEANLVAVQIARLATGRRKILMARGGYHGSAEETEVGTHGHEGPTTLIAPYGDLAAFEAVLAEHGDDIAAVILEPVMGSGGIVEAPEGFLAGIHAATRRAGAVFIVDEVITLRLAPGGCQERHGVVPDITTMGKIIGGGLPVGGVGGRADLLGLLDPRTASATHSGTFNGNPMTTAAGLVSIRELTADRIEVMARLTTHLADGIADAAAAAGLPVEVRRAGSLLGVTLADPDAQAAFHLASLNHGAFFAPRGMLCLSTISDDGTVDAALDRIGAALADVASASTTTARPAARP